MSTAQCERQLANRFRPDHNLLKVTIEALIEKEYLQRSEDDRQDT